MALPGSDSQLVKAGVRVCSGIPTSSLYTLIPSAVRSRIPVLHSLRQSAKTVVLHQVSRPRAYTLSRVERSSTSSTEASSGASTPMRPCTPDDGNLLTQEISARTVLAPETQSGVDWDVAATGVRLWISARSQAEQGGDAAALRSMHIDALRYMHMALPADLTAIEIESLRASMTPQLRSLARNELQVQMRPPVQMGRPSLLRQGVAQVVCWLVAAILLVLPLLMTLLNRVLQFERQHQVTERVITNGLDLTNALGERGQGLQKALDRFKQGRLGTACFDAGAWFVGGIIGGVNDGLDAVIQNRKRIS